MFQLKLKQYLETLHPNLKFKIELEYNNSLPFLDILISKSDNRIVTSVYRKPSHSGVFTHFRSYVPFRYKINMINTLLDRGYKICCSWHTTVGEFQKLTCLLTNNGYNREFVSSLIGRFLNKKYVNVAFVAQEEQHPEDQRVEVNPRKIFCRLPYIEGTSSKVQKTLRGFLQKFDPTGTKFKLIFLDNCTKIGDLFPFKGPLLMRSCIVYHLTCSCGAEYIGQTERNLVDRMLEHGKTQGANLTAVGEHLLDNPDHTVDFANPKVLGSSQYQSKLLIKEAIYIQDKKPVLNSQIYSKKLFVFLMFNPQKVYE